MFFMEISPFPSDYIRRGKKRFHECPFNTEAGTLTECEIFSIMKTQQKKTMEKNRR